MKHLQALLVGLIVVAVTTSIGCVYSLRPWFGEDAQVLDDRLLGEWLNVEEDGSVDDDVVARCPGIRGRNHVASGYSIVRRGSSG